jgi:ribosomal protein S18 acetylase RimI-like enzyme
MTMTATTVRRAAPGPDFDAVARLHADLYRREHGFRDDFAALVEGGLARLAERLEDDPDAGAVWVVDVDGEVAGAIGVTDEGDGRAQLRWVLLDPRMRGRRLGRRLLDTALDHCREAGYEAVFLTTIPQLTAAARMYRDTGFELVSEKPEAPWGGEGTTQIYELRLR